MLHDALIVPLVYCLLDTGCIVGDLRAGCTSGGLHRDENSHTVLQECQCRLGLDIMAHDIGGVGQYGDSREPNYLGKAHSANLDCFNAQDCNRIKTMEGIEENVCVGPAAVCLQVKTLILL